MTLRPKRLILDLRRALIASRDAWRRAPQRGNAAAEFAIMLPIVLTVLFGIIQFGSVLFVMNNMQNAAREAAREFAVGKLTTNAAAQSYAEAYLAGWGLPFVVVATSPVLVTDPPDITVTVTVPAADAALVAFPPLWGTGNLTAFAKFRKEG